MGDSEELPHRLEGVVELVDRRDALDLLRLGHVRVQLARALPEGPPQRRPQLKGSISNLTPIFHLNDQTL